MKFDPVEKIAIYKEHSVDNELLLPSYVSLCRRSGLPSPEEGRILTMETVLKIASAREQMILTASERGHKTPTVASVPDDVVNTIVAPLFGLTPHSNDQTVRMEGQALNNGNTPSDNSVDIEAVAAKQLKGNKKVKANGDVSQELPQNAPSQVSQGNFRATAPAHEYRQNGVGASGGANRVRTTHPFCPSDLSDPNIGRA